MTEKDFRESFRRRMRSSFTQSAEDIAVEAAREAGLEFAPALPALPERLEMDGWHAGAVGYFAFAANNQGQAPFDTVAVTTEAVRRYNTYPPLRAALAELAEAVAGKWQIGALGHKLTGALKAAEAALAEAPEVGS